MIGGRVGRALDRTEHVLKLEQTSVASTSKTMYNNKAVDIEAEWKQYINDRAS